MPKHKRSILWTSVLVGVIALFPQALVPIGMKLSGSVEPVWFLALHLPEPLQWPTIAFMILLGLAAFGLAAWIYISETKRHNNKTEHDRGVATRGPERGRQDHRGQDLAHSDHG